MLCRCLSAALLFCLGWLPLCARNAPAQGSAAPAATAASGAALTYDVVSIKPHKPGDNSASWSWHANSWNATNIPLKFLLADAFTVKSWLISGLPPWAESAHFDIKAKISDADEATLKKLSAEQRHALLLGLLKDHFGLVAHRETKTLPIYELSVTAGGPKLQQTPLPSPGVEGEAAKKRDTGWSIGNGQMKATLSPISTLTDALSSEVERVIVDRTGLTGAYDFELRWTPETQADKAADNGTSDQAPNLFTSLKEQLGLKLTPAKGPVPTVVVDRVTMPQMD